MFVVYNFLMLKSAQFQLTFLHKRCLALV